MIFCFGTGKLTKKPLLRYTKKGNLPVTILSVSCKRMFQIDPERNNNVYQVVFFGKKAELFQRHLDVGHWISFVGELHRDRGDTGREFRPSIYILCHELLPKRYRNRSGVFDPKDARIENPMMEPDLDEESTMDSSDLIPDGEDREIIDPGFEPPEP